MPETSDTARIVIGIIIAVFMGGGLILAFFSLVWNHGQKQKRLQWLENDSTITSTLRGMTFAVLIRWGNGDATSFEPVFTTALLNREVLIRNLDEDHLKKIDAGQEHPEEEVLILKGVISYSLANFEHEYTLKCRLISDREGKSEVVGNIKVTSSCHELLAQETLAQIAESIALRKKVIRLRQVA